MSKNFKKHASLRGVSEANDAATQLRERQLAQATSVTTLPGLAKQNRLDCRAHIRSLAMTQSVECTHGSIPHNALSPYGPIALTPKAHGFTMADRLSRLHTLDPCKTLAFTMAEILLSLTIIGVVAAITN